MTPAIAPDPRATKLHALDAYVSEFLAETRENCQAGASVGERDLARYLTAADHLAKALKALRDIEHGSGPYAIGDAVSGFCDGLGMPDEAVRVVLAAVDCAMEKA